MFPTFTALFELFGKLFDFKTVQTKHQAETEIIEEKRLSRKAARYALDALQIADRYTDKMELSDKKQFEKKYIKFLKEK